MGKPWRKKDGFLVGMMVGMFALIFFTVDKNFAYAQHVTNLALIFTSILFITSVIFGIGSVFRQKSMVSPPFDGFVYGFAISFTVIIVARSLFDGFFPLPFNFS